jgi:hypothetical protein
MDAFRFCTLGVGTGKFRLGVAEGSYINPCSSCVAGPLGYYVQRRLKGGHRSGYLTGNPGIYLGDSSIQGGGELRLGPKALERRLKDARNSGVTIHGPTVACRRQKRYRRLEISTWSYGDSQSGMATL